MAESLVFHYQAINSVLHRFDPRPKTGALLILSPVIMAADKIGLGISTLGIAAVGIVAGLKWSMVIRELRYFSLLLLVLFISRAVFISGDAMFNIGPVIFSKTGIISGGKICWRLVLVVSLGIIYAATTRPKEVRAAVQWMTASIPGIPEKRLGMMIGLLVRFIPLILEQANEIMAAQNARCIQCRKNPYYRLTRFTIPMLRKMIQRSDELTAAMMSRCYNDTPTLPVMRIHRLDWAWFTGVMVFCLLILLERFFLI